MSDLPSAPHTLILADEAATARLGGALAGLWRREDAILLSGPLGVGKSAFARAAIRAACGAEIEVPSPTFTLVQTYEANPPIWHFDLYRLSDADEVVELGWDEALAEGVALVEWPERLADLTPVDHLAISLAPGAGDARAATITGGPSWSDRIERLLEVL